MKSTILLATVLVIAAPSGGRGKPGVRWEVRKAGQPAYVVVVPDGFRPTSTSRRGVSTSEIFKDASGAQLEIGFAAKVDPEVRDWVLETPSRDIVNSKVVKKKRPFVDGSWKGLLTSFQMRAKTGFDRTSLSIALTDGRGIKSCAYETKGGYGTLRQADVLSVLRSMRSL